MRLKGAEFRSPRPTLRNSVSWRTGSLMLYESFSSIGAKYCFVNRVAPSEFGRILTELTPRNKKYEEVQSQHCRSWVPAPFNHCTLDVPNFQMARLGRLLNEPMAVIETLSGCGVSLGPKLIGVLSKGAPDFTELNVCPICIRIGYHSLLHQVRWIIDRCLIHDVDLERMPCSPMRIGRDLCYDTRYVGALYDLWFGSSAVWAEGSSGKWTFPDIEKLKSSAIRIQRSFARLESAYRGAKERGEAVPMFLGEVNEGERLISYSRHFRHDGSAWKLYRSDSGQSWGRGQFFELSSDAGKLISTTSQAGIDWLKRVRRCEVLTLGLNPRWKRVLECLNAKLIKNHRGCAAGLLRVARKWPRSLYVSSPWEKGIEFSAIRLFRKRVMPCHRLVLQELLRYSVSETPVWNGWPGGAGASSITGYFMPFLSVSPEQGIEHYDHPFLSLMSAIVPRAPVRMGFREYEAYKGPVFLLSDPVRALIDELLLGWVFGLGRALALMELEISERHPERSAVDIFERWDTIVRHSEPGFSMEPHVRGIVLRKLRDDDSSQSLKIKADRFSAAHEEGARNMVMRVDKYLTELSDMRSDRCHDICTSIFDKLIYEMRK